MGGAPSRSSGSGRGCVSLLMWPSVVCKEHSPQVLFLWTGTQEAWLWSWFSHSLTVGPQSGPVTSVGLHSLSWSMECQLSPEVSYEASAQSQPFLCGAG